MNATTSADFWDALAPHHGAVEDHYLNRASIRAIAGSIQTPVLVVGAGQGLIVAELLAQGLQCDGLDFSSEMVRQAKLRRGLTLIEADARAMPFNQATYGTIIYATGVIDFMGNEEDIRAILNEGRRVAKPSGKILVTFYRVSRAGEQFLARVGLLKNHVVYLRRSLELYSLNALQMVAWVARQAGISHFKATLLLFSLAARNTVQEKTMTFRMQRIFRNAGVARALLKTAPEEEPYRNETEIDNLFRRLAIPVKQLKRLPSCWIVQI